MTEAADNGTIIFRPSETVHKILLSTPAHVVGEFEGPGILISHAWPPMHSGKRNWMHFGDSPLSRSALVLAFETPQPAKPAPGVIVPNYERAGEVVSSVLSVLFGKRFDSHGPMEMSGHFGVPDLTSFNNACNRSLRFSNNDVRVDLPVPLDLREVRRIIKIILEDTNKDERYSIFLAASGFYRRSLQTIEDDPEVSYLHLITAGEILSSATPYDEALDMDERIRTSLTFIEENVDGGSKISKTLRAQLRGIKRRFVRTLVEHVDDGFFERHESKFRSFKKEDFSRRIGAAYDLRSRYVHTGKAFGGWVTLHMSEHEVQFGQPVVEDKDFAKILALAPMFTGLERVTRYALLRFAEELGADLRGLTNPVND